MPAVPEFSFTTIDTDGLCVISCTGELDMASADPLLNMITDRLGAGNVVLDASGISFLDCAGLSALISGYHVAKALHRSFSLAAPSVAVLRLLVATEALDRLEMHSCVPSATRTAAVRDVPVKMP